MQSRIITVLLFLILLSCICHATIRTIGWDYSALTNKSDLIVIAEPINVRELDEVAKLPGTEKDIKMIGVETIFSVKIILKGNLDGESLVLHHYRLQDDLKIMLSSAEKPLLVRFDIPKEDEYPKYCYLLFLKIEKDGRFVPVSGQFNAALSIKRLPDLANYK